ncbi:MAG: hypothetical protein IT315_04710 [Anaerolineales bacterium]|nr:hypothetical protein [Anaerolineales bacterium]
MTQNSTSVQPLKTLRVALQSALAAALFLGFPAGLLFWMILFREAKPSAAVDSLITLLQANGINKILALTICSLGWSFSLGRIGGFHAWWKIGLATALGFTLAWFSPLSNLDGWFADRMPIPLLYTVTLCGIVFSVTFCVGFAYGIILRNLKAALTMAFSTSFISTLALLLAILVFNQFGVYVGSAVPFAMSKVTTVSLLVSAIAGGAVLGAMFALFVENGLNNP